MSEYITYGTVSRIQGPLLFLEGVVNAGYDEIVEVSCPDGSIRYGRVLEAGIKYVLIEVFGGTSGLSLAETKVTFRGKPLEVRVSDKMLGRIFNGFGDPIDGGPKIIDGQLRDINSSPINPMARAYPKESIQTGISAIDALNTLVRGQKLPIFSGAGLPHSELAAQIARQATIVGEEEKFVVVFAAMGLKHATADFFRTDFERSGAFKDVDSGAYVDPTTVTFRTKDPSGNLSAHDYGVDVNVTTPATGSYRYDLLLDEAGDWWLRWEGTGSPAGARQWRVHCCTPEDGTW